MTGKVYGHLIDVIASQVGYEWTVDAFKNFWYYPVTSTEIEAPFNLSADPADDDTSSSSYDLQWREGTSGAWTTVSGLTNLHRVFTGLSSITTYQFRIKLSSESSSEYSPIGSVTTIANSNPTVTISTFNQIVAGGATVSIDATISDSDDSISDLEVMWTGSGTFNNDELVDVVWTAPATQNTDQDYTLTVTVTDPFGAQGSATITFTVEGTAVSTVPATPALPTVSNITMTSVRLTWVAPDDGGSSITSYSYRYRVRGVPPWITVTGETGLTADITGLTEDTEYQFRVRATNSIGDSIWSSIAEASTLAMGIVDTAPTFIDDMGNAQTWTQNDAIATLTVPTADGSPTPTYAVVGSLPAGISFNTNTRVISGTPTAVTSGTITIRATNSAGSDDWTVDYTTTAAATVPSRPSSLSLVVDSDTQITATGVAPNDGGDTITSYDWRYRTTSPLGNWVNRFDVTDLEQVFSGLSAEQGYRFQFRATNSVGNSTYSPNADATTEAAPIALTVPAFSDDVGDAQTWTENEAITAITVPVATGTPTPTYAAIGTLPTGITFNTTTRVLSGTPTVISTGTIRIRASNSEGSDDWTISYDTSAASTEGSVTVPLAGVSVFTNYIRWSDNQSLGSAFSADGGSQTLNLVDLNNASPSGNVVINLTTTNDRFTAAFEASGRIIFEASDGETLEVTIGNADTSEPYSWVPSNSLEVVAFVLHVKGLVDQDATLTLTDEVMPITLTAPSFTDDTGDAQDWTQDAAITSITVPAATGNPTPTYAVVGTLPTGISFNTSSRVLSGTPTSTGTGTIRIRATNSQGSDDWTVAYTTSAQLTAPVFADNTGDDQDWIQDEAITSITVPAATGNPTPTICRCRKFASGY